MVQAIYENGFPYLLIIPSYIAMTFAIISPSFSNFDDRLSPTTTSNIPLQQPAWIGFQTSLICGP